MSLGWLRCIPLQLELTAVAVEMSGAQMVKLYLSYVKVFVGVATGADDHVLLPLRSMLLRSLTASFLNV